MQFINFNFLNLKAFAVIGIISKYNMMRRSGANYSNFMQIGSLHQERDTERINAEAGNEFLLFV